MNLWKSLAGQVVMELTSADPERAVSALSQAGIELLRVRPAGDLCLHLTMSRSQAAQALRLCEKRGDQLKPLAGKGLYWTGKGLLKRPVLLLSLVVLLLATVMLP